MCAIPETLYGKKSDTAHNEPWGIPLSSSSDLAIGFNYRFVGSLGVRWDETLQMYYMRQRFYDPAIQRFISRDPLGAANRYSYCEAQPLRFIDPTGLRPYSAAENLAYSDALGIISRITGEITYRQAAHRLQAMQGQIVVDSPLLADHGFSAATAYKYKENVFTGNWTEVPGSNRQILLSSDVMNGKEYRRRFTDVLDYRYGNALLLAMNLLKEEYHYKGSCPTSKEDNKRREWQGYNEVLYFLVKLLRSESNPRHRETVKHLGSFWEATRNGHLTKLYGKLPENLPSFFPLYEGP